MQALASSTSLWPLLIAGVCFVAGSLSQTPPPPSSPPPQCLAETCARIACNRASDCQRFVDGIVSEPDDVPCDEARHVCVAPDGIRDWQPEGTPCLANMGGVTIQIKSSPGDPVVVESYTYGPNTIITSVARYENFLLAQFYGFFNVTWCLPWPSDAYPGRTVEDAADCYCPPPPLPPCAADVCARIACDTDDDCAAFAGNSGSQNIVISCDQARRTCVPFNSGSDALDEWTPEGVPCVMRLGEFPLAIQPEVGDALDTEVYSFANSAFSSIVSITRRVASFTLSYGTGAATTIEDITTCLPWPDTAEFAGRSLLYDERCRCPVATPAPPDAPIDTRAAAIVVASVFGSLAFVVVAAVVCVGGVGRSNRARRGRAL